MIARTNANAAALHGWVANTPWIANLADDPGTASTTSVCLKLVDTPAEPKRIAALLGNENAAYDIGAYRKAPPGLRIWCGATVETDDINALLPWLDWAHATALQETS